MKGNSLVRVRFAPSPTGVLHVGGVRTALFNYLFAKKHQGSFILRVEDTDTTRSNDSYLTEQLENLKWLGLNWDDGPYRQSERLHIYRHWAYQLIKKGHAYYCFLSEAECEAQKKQSIQNTPFRIKSPYRDESLQTAEAKIQAGEKATIRFKASTHTVKQYSFTDIVRGDISFPSDMVGDFILIRANGMPVYNFSCAVDDHLMHISHVLRSEEHLPNTLRQLMIFDALLWKRPLFGHLSIIQGSDRKKLSKRHGAVSCKEYKKQGYLPEALVNFLALLGWNPKTTQEFFLLPELIKLFSLKGLHTAPAVFDEKKLKWLNSQHIKQSDDLLLWSKLNIFFRQKGLEFPNSNEWRKKAVQTLKTSFTTLLEGAELFQALSLNEFKIYPSAKVIYQWSSTMDVLKAWEECLKSHKDTIVESKDFLSFVKLIQTKVKVKGKFLFMPLRVAVMGYPEGAELKTIVPLLTRDILLQRVKKACLINER